MRLGPHQKRRKKDLSPFFLCHIRTQTDSICLQAKKWVSPETKPASTFILDFLTPEQCLLFKPSTLQYFIIHSMYLLKQPKLTKTVSTILHSPTSNIQENVPISPHPANDQYFFLILIVKYPCEVLPSHCFLSFDGFISTEYSFSCVLVVIILLFREITFQKHLPVFQLRLSFIGQSLQHI